MTPHDIALILYNLMLVPMIFLSVLHLMLCLLSIGVSKKEKKFGILKEYPFVSVQIPSYNDPIAERCIKKCLEFDYPENRYEIVIADDSTHSETQKRLAEYEKKYPGKVKYLHRNNRAGFKAGALQEAMKHTKGEIIVIFDADWMPEKDFLLKAVKPFSDPKIALVQTRQGFYNRNVNFITRFASYTLMAYHAIIMPIHDRFNSVFFCGTAGAIRRSAFDEVGGWNLNSLTEDSEITIRILAKGYKSVYLDFETQSEVPETFEGFVKQQMRWCYGNARVFFDNASQILFRRGLTVGQRCMIMYTTLFNVTAPVVVLMTTFGFAGWLLGEPSLIQLRDITTLLWRFFATAGFLAVGFLTLYRRKLLSELPKMAISILSIGMVLAVGNTIAFSKAVLNRKLHWFCTPKIQNDSIA